MILRRNNLVWCQEHHYLIDWELAGWIDPGVELLAAAIDFSLINKVDIDSVKLHSVLQGYGDCSYLLANFDACFYALMNIWLLWLQYLLKINRTKEAQNTLSINGDPGPK